MLLRDKVLFKTSKKGVINIDNIIDTIDGKLIEVNTTTGEATEMITIVAPIGTKWITPEQQEKAKIKAEYLKGKEEKEYYKKLNKRELGNFYWILADDVFVDISPQTVTKLVMLCTYLYYDDMFRKSAKSTIKKKDLQRILNISKKATYDFWNEVKDKYIIERDGNLYICEDANIFRGQLPKHKQMIAHYQKAYIKSIRTLYKATNVRKHKQLGYIFKLLPHINLQFNIFCTDPFEQELDNIVPLSITDLCALIGYNVSQSTRLIKELQSLTFEHNHQHEFLISFVDNGNNTPRNKMIFINPHVVFNGSDYRRVEILGAFCKTNSGNSRH